ncbi:MAG: biopolymer transporter ExbD [Akkermansia sp.]
MRIYQRKHGNEGIPIVPMLDILTILLIFFIVQTEFKRQVKVLNLALPDTENLAGDQGNKDHVLLELGADGQVALDGKLIKMSQLAHAATELKKSHPEATVQVYAAKGSSMGQFIEAMDHLTASGMDVEEIPVRINYKGN